MPATDPTVIAAAIGTVIAAFGAMAVMIINAWFAAKDRARQLELLQAVHKSNEEAIKKTEKVLANTDKLHELANGTNSNLQTAIDVLAERAKGYETLIAQMETAKLEAANAKLVADAALAGANGIHGATPSPAK